MNLPVKIFRYVRWRVTRNFGDRDFQNDSITFRRYFRYKAGQLTGSTNYQKFVVITSARTGSNMLMSMLDNHPGVYVRGECMAFRRNKDIGSMLDKLYGKHPKGIQAVGFKAFFYHPFDDDSGELWERLQERNDLRVIFLFRKNKIRQYLSLRRASQSKQWWALDNQGKAGEEQKIVLDAEKLEGFVTEQYRFEKEFTKRFAGRSMTLFYEDLVDSPGRAVSTIGEFLGGLLLSPETKLERQSFSALEHQVENIEDLKSRLSGPPWDEMFTS